MHVMLLYEQNFGHTPYVHMLPKTCSQRYQNPTGTESSINECHLQQKAEYKPTEMGHTDMIRSTNMYCKSMFVIKYTKAYLKNLFIKYPRSKHYNSFGIDNRVGAPEQLLGGLLFTVQNEGDGLIVHTDGHSMPPEKEVILCHALTRLQSTYLYNTEDYGFFMLLCPLDSAV